MHSNPVSLALLLLLTVDGFTHIRLVLNMNELFDATHPTQIPATMLGPPSNTVNLLQTTRLWLAALVMRHTNRFEGDWDTIIVDEGVLEALGL